MSVDDEGELGFITLKFISPATATTFDLLDLLYARQCDKVRPPPTPN